MTKPVIAAVNVVDAVNHPTTAPSGTTADRRPPHPYRFS